MGGGKMMLVPRDVFLNESCPENDISKMVRGKKDFDLQNGFIKLYDQDPDTFTAFLDFLQHPDEIYLPEDEEKVQKLIEIAQYFNVDAMKKKIKERQIIENSGTSNSNVLTFRSQQNANDAIAK